MAPCWGCGLGPRNFRKIQHPAPVGWVGRCVLAGMSYMGGVVLLAFEAARAGIQPTQEELEAPIGLGKTLVRQLSWMLALGIPLVGLVHIALGSFLSLQAYYGSTFVDGTGAVVGVGLLRNLATLMTGMTLSGLLAGRMIPDLLHTGSAPADDPVALPGSGGRIARVPGPFAE